MPRVESGRSTREIDTGINVALGIGIGIGIGYAVS